MKKSKGIGLNITWVIFIVFLILKLTGTINWSWWWVCSPIGIPLAIIALCCFIVGAIEIYTRARDKQ